MKRDQPTFPWRRRAAERQTAKTAASRERNLKSEKATARRESEAESRKKQSALEQYVKPIVLAAALAFVSFNFGQYAESKKLHAQDERLAVENRRRVFSSSAQEFGIYLTQWGRLRSVARAELSLMKSIEIKHNELSSMGRSTKASSTLIRRQTADTLKAQIIELEKVVKRKERYIEGRDAAKDKLTGNLEQARLFFGSSTEAAISTFEAFEREHGNKRLTDLPPLADWRKHSTAIFNTMMQEIRHDETKLSSAPVDLSARQRGDVRLAT